MVLLPTITAGTPARPHGMRQGSGASGNAPTIQLIVRRHGQPPILVTIALWLPVLPCRWVFEVNLRQCDNKRCWCSLHECCHAMTRDMVSPA